MQTSDLELAHAQRYQRASGEGEKPSPGQKLWVINRRGEFGPPSAVKFGRLRGIKEWRSRAISRSSSEYVGMGLFLLCFPDRYGPLQESVGPNEGLVAEAISGGSANVAGLSSTPDTATPPPGISHLRVGGPSTTTAAGWAFDYDGYGASITTTAATLQRVARTKDEDAIEGNGESERSRSRPKVLPPKHIPVRQSMVAINLDAPIPVPGPTPESKAQLPPPAQMATQYHGLFKSKLLPASEIFWRTQRGGP